MSEKARITEKILAHSERLTEKYILSRLQLTVCAMEMIVLLVGIDELQK